MTARIRVGTASWTDHQPFYPAEYARAGMKPQRISYYARYFSLVEVDSTFYTLQPTRNFQLWAERTPDDFIFDVKAFGELTWHHRDDSGTPITPSAETFQKFGAMLQPLQAADKLGAVLFQFPPWFRASEDNEEYLTGLPRRCLISRSSSSFDPGHGSGRATRAHTRSSNRDRVGLLRG